MNDELKGKFSNIFIKLLLGIQMRDLEDVKHLLSDDLYNKYNDICQRLIERNEAHMYDEMNVKSISIKTSSDEEYDIANVHIVSRYMDYIMDVNTGKKKSGIDDHRVEIEHDLVFKKEKGAKRGSVVKCAGCGANLDANNSGVCDYCGTVHSAIEYDYILTSITNL